MSALSEDGFVVTLHRTDDERLLTYDELFEEVDAEGAALPPEQWRDGVWDASEYISEACAVGVYTAVEAVGAVVVRDSGETVVEYSDDDNEVVAIRLVSLISVSRPNSASATSDLGSRCISSATSSANVDTETTAPSRGCRGCTGELMNKIIGVAGIGAAMAMAIGTLAAAGAASASVEGFVQEMDTPFATHDEQLAEGNSFCTALTRGSDQQLPGPAAAAIITNFSNFNASQGRAGVYATKLMVAAVKELCPANNGFFMTAARAYDAQTGE